MSRSKNLSALLLLALVLAMLAPLTTVIAEEEKQTTDSNLVKLTGIDIEGTHKLKAKDLKNVMHLKKGNKYKEYLLKYLLQTDINSMKDRYSSEGFFNAKIDYELTKKKPGEQKIKITIDEGPRCLITKLDVQGPVGITMEERKRVWMASRLKVGDPLIEGLINTAEQNIFTYYSNMGYIYAQVHTGLTYNEDKTGAEVVFVVDPLHIAHIGDVVVQGNNKVQEEIILRELTFKKGEVYDPQKISDTQRRIYSTHLFRDVKIRPIDYELAPEIVDLIIMVREDKFHWMEVSPGYESPDRARLSLSWGHDNIFGHNQRLTVSGTVSYGFSSKEDIESLSASYQVPWVLGLPFSASLSPYWIREKHTNYKFYKLGAQLELEKDFTKKLTGICDLDYYHIRFFGQSTDGGTTLPEKELTNITSLGISLRYDSRPNPFNPLDGSYSYLSTAMAGGILPSDYDYLRFITEVNRYMPVRSEVVFAIHLRFAQISPFGKSRSIPVFERFFGGGAFSVRGFRERQLGPKDSEGNPIGGDTLLAGGLELRFRLPLISELTIPWINLSLNNLWGALFSDVGNVFGTFNDFKFNQLHTCVGAGIRYNTPVGPLRLDYARELAAESSGVWYIALGHAF
jgi:outer membrane protein insertion porin family